MGSHCPDRKTDNLKIKNFLLETPSGLHRKMHFSSSISAPPLACLFRRRLGDSILLSDEAEWFVNATGSDGAGFRPRFRRDWLQISSANCGRGFSVRCTESLRTFRRLRPRGRRLRQCQSRPGPARSEAKGDRLVLCRTGETFLDSALNYACASEQIAYTFAHTGWSLPSVVIRSFPPPYNCWARWWWRLLCLVVVVFVVIRVSASPGQHSK